MSLKRSLIVAGVPAVIVSSQPQRAAMQGGKAGSDLATLVTLPSLGSNAQALGINAAGSVIVGDAFDKAGFLHAVKWTLQGGTWIEPPYPGNEG